MTMADPSANTIVEEREALMVSPTGGIPTLRTAHFIKPIYIATKEQTKPKPTISEPKNNPLKVDFKGRTWPQKGWKTWVENLKSLYQPLWKKAGIHEAILASTYQTLRHNELVIELAEKWCIDTNTFIFPWGEATITLEDMLVLGGYSVLGEFVFSPLVTRDQLRSEENLRKTLGDIKMGNAGYVTHGDWMEHFMGSGGLLEHQAFLCLWLNRYVLPTTSYIVVRYVFPIAIRLSEGTPLALAPAVLASIYRDLGLLKKSISLGDCCMVTLSAPFQLVQLWAWERLPTLGPNPNGLKYGEPRSARWHRLQKLKIEDVKKAIDSAGECFLWKPYATVLNNWEFCKFYKEKEEWAVVGMDERVETYARCVRDSELVGVDCIKQYLPHRVAMQFGLDQDIPALVTRSNQTRGFAWSNYVRPTGDAKIYIPPRLFESDVTLRYIEWWNPINVKRFCVRAGETQDNVEQDTSKIAQMVDSTSQSDFHSVRDDEPLLHNCFQSISPLQVDGVSLEKTKPKVNNNDFMESPHRGTEDADWDQTNCPFVSIDLDEEKNDAIEVSVPELEARISKLEEVIARRKASKNLMRIR